jgi:hypothetical protein
MTEEVPIAMTASQAKSGMQLLSEANAARQKELDAELGRIVGKYLQPLIDGFAEHLPKD